MAGSESPLTPRRRLRNELWVSRQAGWWRAYADVAPGRLLELIDYETAASAISQFELMAVPGILQTEEYARAVLRASYDAGSLRSEEHTSELQSHVNLVCRLLL